MGDPLLDRPSRVPRWIPSVDDGRAVRRLGWMIAVVALLAVGVVVIDGANTPPDPSLGEPVSTADDADLLDGPGGETDGDDPGTTSTSGSSAGEPFASPAAVLEPADPPFETFGARRVTLVRADGTTIGWCVLVAAEAAARAQGLMGVTDLGRYDGMLFTFDEDVSGGFHMFSTPMPLTIAWFDAEGRWVGQADMEPCVRDSSEDCPDYLPDRAFRAALEAPVGVFDEVGVGDGSSLSAGARC